LLREGRRGERRCGGSKSEDESSEPTTRTDVSGLAICCDEEA
jgi:hypothetical protein